MQVDKDSTIQKANSAAQEAAYQGYIVNQQAFMAKLRTEAGAKALIEELGAEKYQSVLKMVDSSTDSFDKGMSRLISQVNNDLAMRLQITDESSKEEKANFEYVKRFIASSTMKDKMALMKQYPDFNQIPQEVLSNYVLLS